MRAMVLEKAGQPLQLRDVSRPKPDGLREGKETATFTLTNGTGYRITTLWNKKKASVTIPKNRT